MSSSLDLFLKRLRDPRWIPHISDYCDHRCERCAFSGRCWSYALRQHEESPDSEPVPEVPTEEEEEGTRHVEGWVERHGIDLDDLTMDASETKAYEQFEERIKNDPLGKRARAYDTDVWQVLQTMMPAEREGGWGGAAPGSELSNALGDTWGLALVIGAKTNRAISSLEYNKHEDFAFEEDAIQTDANGSAKVARLAITSSLAAWAIVQSAGLLDPGLVSYLTANLRQIESELTDRFPLAMAFVRPGFDEEIPGIVRPWSIMPQEDDEDEEDRTND
jgi:hypothetical protein